MWSIKSSLMLSCFCLVSCGVAQEAATSVCPAKQNSFVKSVDVYDGPLADMVILIPDEATETEGYWNLSYVYEAGRTVNIQCKYADKTSVDINLANKITQCRYSFAHDKGLLLHCH